MPELEAVETPKNAGFVQRGTNYARKQDRMKKEEEEIARLEAQARGEEVKENEPNGEGSEATEVQAEDNTKQEEANPEVEAQEDDSDLDAEEKSFKKRYGDLRRHLQQKEKEWEEKFNSFEARIKKEAIVPPKSDEDIENWAKEYPDVAGIVETIAAKKAQEMFDKAEDRLSRLDELQYETERKTAEAKIREAHPSFDTLRQSDEFHQWADSQPEEIKGWIYSNATNATLASRAIDLFKQDVGKSKSKDEVSGDLVPASEMIQIKNSKDVGYGSKKIWTRSQIAAMSQSEFDKNEKSITEAMAEGRVVNDNPRRNYGGSGNPTY